MNRERLVQNDTHRFDTLEDHLLTSPVRRGFFVAGKN